MNRAATPDMMATTEGDGRPPVVILTPQSNVTSGAAVQEKLITAALALGNIIRSTFGPRGLDKMMYKSDGNTAVTNDGAKIISELLVKHPAAKAFVSLGQAQESTCGDGVTGCILFATELMREAGRLIRKGLHPLTVIEGWRQALDITLETMENSSIPIDNQNLIGISSTSLVGKGAQGALQQFSTLVVEAAMEVTKSLPQIEELGSENILMCKSKKGSIQDSRLLRGLVIEKRLANDKLPRNLMNPSVALLTCPLEFETPTRDSEIEITDPEQLSAFLAAGEQSLDKIANHILSLGTQAVFCGGAIDPRVLHTLCQNNVFALGDLDEVEMKNIAAATGAKIVDLVRDLSTSDLGGAGVIRTERREGAEGIEERILVEECTSPKVVTIEVGGSNDIFTEEVIRGLHDSLKATTLAIREGRAVNGGGHVHCVAALAIRTKAEESADRERLAIESFARALESIPLTLASNAGKEGLDVLLELRAAIRNQPGEVIGVKENGEVGDVSTVMIPLESLQSSFIGAFETASSLLRVDQVISARGD